MTQQKTALVTGASSGMGKVIAKQLLNDGLTVIVAARRVAQMADLKAPGAHPITLDVSKEDRLTAAAPEIEERIGGVDILVNNAGFGLYGALELSPFGIDVVVIEPGIIQTEFGSVVEGPMKKHSCTGLYAEMAVRVANATAGSYKEGGGSSPQVIADTVSRVVKTHRPGTRYAVGKYAKPMIRVRKWLGDRAFDRMVLSTVR